jgi:DNA-binding response OmpR family regulator
VVRILIVEDERPLAAAIADGLTLEGYDCDVVHDGNDGLWRATEDTYAAIVLDLLLPGINGFIVCRRLREVSNWTPVLVLTAKDGDYDLVEALECGADDFLSKPFSFAVLTARLKALIRRGHVPRPDALELGDVWLDPYTRKCSIAGTPVALTSREASVLEVLLRQRDRHLQRGEILDAVWGIDFDGNAMIVDVYISHLRKKLAVHNATTKIVNNRGHGFALRRA